jgi:vancomycin resistance protein YoaR
MKKDITVKIDTVNGLNSQTGKSEEIAILQEITERMAGTQTYLESLFTGDLLEWFEGKVHDDFCPNIMAEYHAELENSRNYQNELYAANTQIANLTAQIDRNKENARSMIAAKESTIADLTDRLTAHQVVLAKCRVALTDEQSIKAAIISERDDLKAQIKDLKVMLFDLQNSKAA